MAIEKQDFVIDPGKIRDYIGSCKKHLMYEEEGANACMKVICEDCPFNPKLNQRKEINCKNMTKTKKLYTACKTFLKLFDK